MSEHRHPIVDRIVEHLEDASDSELLALQVFYLRRREDALEKEIAIETERQRRLLGAKALIPTPRLSLIVTPVNPEGNMIV